MHRHWSNQLNWRRKACSNHTPSAFDWQDWLVRKSASMRGFEAKNTQNLLIFSEKSIQWIGNCFLGLMIPSDRVEILILVSTKRPGFSTLILLKKLRGRKMKSMPQNDIAAVSSHNYPNQHCVLILY
ncbi:hypothetical protein HJG60_012007 [Phyllostomus discolor]|uniref:Uncharacterized protein n=1 Tax=Phyllostomus discolor TaxID=89673 RepID=A0A833ZM00_9CHIR|nr:hypothetical protein HJG60_012007 [Phyllostomus discolor]